MRCLITISGCARDERKGVAPRVFQKSHPLFRAGIVEHALVIRVNQVGLTSKLNPPGAEKQVLATALKLTVRARRY